MSAAPAAMTNPDTGAVVAVKSDKHAAALAACGWVDASSAKPAPKSAPKADTENEKSKED